MCICQSEMDTARRLEERDGEFEFTYMLHRKLVLGLRLGGFGCLLLRGQMINRSQAGRIESPTWLQSICLFQ